MVVVKTIAEYWAVTSLAAFTVNYIIIRPASMMTITSSRLKAWGSRRNKFTVLDVEAPGRQDAEAQEYQAYFELLQRSQAGWIDVQNVKLFLSEPLVPYN